MDEFFVGLATAALCFVLGFINERWARRCKKRVLRNRLTKDGWKWRRIQSLSRSIRENEESTKELLNDLPELQHRLRQLFMGKKDRLLLFMLCKSCMEVSTVPLAIQKRIVQPPKFELVGKK